MSRLATFLGELLAYCRISSLPEHVHLYPFVACNTLICYTLDERFDAAAELLGHEDLLILQKCFAQSFQWNSLRLLIQSNGGPHRNETLEELQTLVSEMLDSFWESLRYPLFSYSCILGKALFDSERFSELSELNARCADYLSCYSEWNVNCGHTFFAQGMYSEAASCFQAAVEKSHESLLNLTPVALANLCVSLLETDQNRRAESLISEIYSQESRNNTGHLHSTIVNLLVGYVYCTRQDFGFGLDRVLEAVEDDINITAETWSICKEIFMRVVNRAGCGLCPIIPDEIIHRTVNFLDRVGGLLPPIISGETSKSVQEEAKMISDLFTKVFFN